MQNQAYLVFRLQELQYGIPALLVQEVFQLPELTPLAEAPQDIIGLLNLRGKMIPVMHLACRFGQKRPLCQLSNSMIVIDWQGLQMGIVVDQVQDVLTLDPSLIDIHLDYGRAQPGHVPFMSGVAQEFADPIILLNPERLVRQPDQVAMIVWEAELQDPADADVTDLDQTEDLEALAQKWEAMLLEDSPEVSLTELPLAVEPGISPPSLSEPEPEEPPATGLSNFYDLYCPTASVEEKAIFRQRAADLRPTSMEAEASDQVSIAVIQLSDQYFGIELDLVREFINIRSITPIPCCPKYIVGNINLRGEVMTLVDIQSALHLQVTSAVARPHKAIVFEVEDVVAGITVDEVVDVTYLSPTEVMAMPAALPEDYRQYLQGTVAYHDQFLNILDLKKVITQGVLKVNQTRADLVPT